ncbi:MAG: CpaF family protein [Candidatus Omnitrophica bacterium]|nr:CpaF family protein [Candidatus Omnitrophota bacterium]
MLNPMGLAVNESNPLCDASLPDGSRINVIIPPLALNGPVVTIRRTLRKWEMQEYVALDSLDDQAAELLEACVRAKVNMAFSGGTSTGKTTLVAILSQYIPATERIITIENVPELELSGREHWIRLIAKAPNFEGRGEVLLRTLVKNALRMRPDRIILGEARGGEALDVVQAMHSGHDGFLTVLHANSPLAALERLQILMQMSGLDVPPAACRMQIANAVDLVIHMARFVDGSRRIETITQVLGATEGGFELEDLFTFESQGFSSNGQLQGKCRYTGVRPKFLRKFHLNNVPVPSWVSQ